MVLIFTHVQYGRKKSSTELIFPWKKGKITGIVTTAAENYAGKDRLPMA